MYDSFNDKNTQPSFSNPSTSQKEQLNSGEMLNESGFFVVRYKKWELSDTNFRH